ncbi:MAG: helix-turn-helix domain-containing protein [Oscillospiraceae bacterium]
MLSVSSKLRALLNVNNKKTQDLAECLGISIQAVRNKFTRNSFSATDLIKISEYLQSELTFNTVSNQKIILDKSDLEPIVKVGETD